MVPRPVLRDDESSRTWRQIINLPDDDMIDLQPDVLTSCNPIGPMPGFMRRHFLPPPEGFEYCLTDSAKATDCATVTEEGRYCLDRTRHYVGKLVPIGTPHIDPGTARKEGDDGVAPAGRATGVELELGQLNLGAGGDGAPGVVVVAAPTETASGSAEAATEAPGKPGDAHPEEEPRVSTLSLIHI